MIRLTFKASIISAVLLLLMSCAGPRQLTTSEMNLLEDNFYDMLDARQKQISNSAYLIQVRVKSPDLKQKFNLEVYFEGDSVSFYSPGFLGKGTFKGIIKGDSLRFYFPSEKAYYSGLWYELTDPDLGHWRDVFGLVLNLLGGGMIPPGKSGINQLPYKLESADDRNTIERLTNSWRCQYLFDGDRFDKAVYGWIRDLLMVNFHIKSYQDEFPYFEFEKAYIYYNNRLQVSKSKNVKLIESEIRLTFIHQKFNINIPPEKFELEIPSSAEKIYRLIPE